MVRISRVLLDFAREWMQIALTRLGVFCPVCPPLSNSAFAGWRYWCVRSMLHSILLSHLLCVVFLAYAMRVGCLLSLLFGQGGPDRPVQHPKIQGVVCNHPA